MRLTITEDGGAFLVALEARVGRRWWQWWRREWWRHERLVGRYESLPQALVGLAEVFMQASVKQHGAHMTRGQRRKFAAAFAQRIIGVSPGSEAGAVSGQTAHP